ncbi:MAG: hypothetical protein JNM66_05690 [Bryobacterales bacterium]|nr:hypothetical protein [Bryobacterales bacterium]
MPISTRIFSLLFAGALLGAPAAFAFSTGPRGPVAGVPTDNNGANCTACHRTFAPANSDNTGRFQILVDRLTYTPGVTKKIRIKIEHPEAQRWGFQFTSRQASDTTKGAGTLVGNDSILVRCGLTIALPPCAGEPEPQFAEHTQASTRAGTRAGVEWEFDWTPPANEVGDITFFAAGNAADNTNTNANDRIYTTSITLKAEGACNLTRKPTLRTVGNAASFARELSPNLMASVFGLDFEVAGRTRAASTGDFVDGAFPQQLACVAVEIGGRRAPITYVQTDQINFQVPAGTPAGSVPLTVILNPGRPNEVKSDVATVTVNNHAPAFFTFGGRSIAAQTSDFRTIADPAVVPGGVAARRGDVVILYGTGFGLGEPVYQAGEIASGQVPLRDRVTITVGGTALPAADILYAGLAPGNISGLQQFNIRIPQSAATGNLPISIMVGGVSTPAAGAVIPVQ